MSWVATPGLQYPPPFFITYPLAFNTGGLIDATGEMFAFVGAVDIPGGATKNIQTVGFCFGTVVKAGGSALTVSLQDVSLSAGPVYVPDEVQDQTVAIANANAAFASGAWLQTGNLSAVRAVAPGELLSVVIEYDGAGRLGADSAIIRTITGGQASNRQGSAGAVLKTGGTWAALNSFNSVILGFDDGTFGTLVGAIPTSAITSPAFNSGSAADEIGVEFTIAAAMKVCGGWSSTLIVAGADFDHVLYDASDNVVASKSFDSNVYEVLSAAKIARSRWADVILTPGTYRFVVKPTTANNVTIYDLAVSSASHMQAYPLGATACFCSRVDAGAWTTTTTRRPMMGLELAAISDGGFPASRIALGM